MNIIFEDTCSLLNEIEWRNNINAYINKIKKTKVGKLLLKELDIYMKEPFNYTITIKNYSYSKSFQYPHCNVNGKNLTVFIPSNPYFIEVFTFNKDLIEEGQSNYIIKNILNCKPVNNKLDKDFIASFSKNEFQPFVVILFHELIHCLRIITLSNEGKLESEDEEEVVIYGLKNDTLQIDNKYITENSFRKELNLGRRLSHDSNYLNVYGTSHNKNYDKKTLKKMFLNLEII